jgi:hypothetical protein
MASIVEICNMALSHLGTGKEIAVITENSEEANACNRFYETSRDGTIEDYPWPFARTFATLALVLADPTDEWSYSYRYPVDCLRFSRIQSGNTIDTRQSRVSYILASDVSGRLIITNKENAKCEYYRSGISEAYFTPSFSMALSFRLAMLIAPRLTKGDPTKIKNDMYRLYLGELDKVKANSVNEEQQYEEVESAIIRSRTE